jgi:hypothetical protein
MLYLNCEICKRTLIPGALYADGFTDTERFCHNCRALEFDGILHSASIEQAALKEEPENDEAPDLMDDDGYL